MKKISLFKKIRLAFMAEGWFMKLLVMIYPIMLFSLIFDDESDFLRGMGLFCYSVLMASMSNVYMSAVMGNMKLYRVMPMRNCDIVDVATIHSLLGMIIVSLPHIVVFPIAGKLDILPYYLCMDCILLATTTAVVIWYAKDKYVGAQAKDMNDDEATVKKHTRRVMLTAIGWMFLEGVAGFIVLLQSLNPDPAADVAWLIAVSAVGVIAYGVICLTARKIKNAFVY